MATDEKKASETPVERERDTDAWCVVGFGLIVLWYVWQLCMYEDLRQEVGGLLWDILVKVGGLLLDILLKVEEIEIAFACHARDRRECLMSRAFPFGTPQYEGDVGVA